MKKDEDETVITISPHKDHITVHCPCGTVRRYKSMLIYCSKKAVEVIADQGEELDPKQAEYFKMGGED